MKMGNQQRNSNLLEKIKTKYENGESLIKLSQQYSIGPCPILCYKYKWITRRSETIMEES